MIVSNIIPLHDCVLMHVLNEQLLLEMWRFMSLNDMYLYVKFFLELNEFVNFEFLL